MFELALDILLSQVVTNIEATLASSGITLLADVFTGLLLLLKIGRASCRERVLRLV